MAIEWGKFARMEAWAATLPAETLTLLPDAGFVAVERGPLAQHLPSVLVRPVHDRGLASEPSLGGRRLLDPATWDMRMVYSMAG